MEPTMNTLLNFAMPRLRSQCLKRGSRRFIEIVRENACIKGLLPGIQLVFVRRDRGFWMFGLIRMPRVTDVTVNVQQLEERWTRTFDKWKRGSDKLLPRMVLWPLPLVSRLWGFHYFSRRDIRMLAAPDFEGSCDPPHLHFASSLSCWGVLSLSLSFSVYKLYMHPCRLMYHTSRHLCEWVSTQGDIIHAKCTVQVYRCIYDYILIIYIYIYKYV